MKSYLRYTEQEKREYWEKYDREYEQITLKCQKISGAMLIVASIIVMLIGEGAGMITLALGLWMLLSKESLV